MAETPGRSPSQGRGTSLSLRGVGPDAEIGRSGSGTVGTGRQRRPWGDE